jgi:hypothetical protein
VIIAAHQPGFLPWLGYLAKVAAADLFVVMDDLQYEAQNFQNRNRIKNNHGAFWLTVPLERGPQSAPICQKQIANVSSPREHWQWRHWETLRIHYGSAAHWKRYADPLEEVFRRPWQRLLDLDLHILRLCLGWFEIDTPILLSSSLALSGQKTDRILDLCRKTGADVYLSGRGGSTAYLDVAKLVAAGVSVAWQPFRHPVYPQRYPSVGFISHLSAIDLLLNCGPDSPRILRDAMQAPAEQEQVQQLTGS